MNKQTFPIPEGCKAISMEIIDNQIVTTFEPQFKRGDVIAFKDGAVCVVDIIKEKLVYEIVGVTGYGHITFGNGNHFSKTHFFSRHATPEETQRLWDALAKEGKRWNPEKMEVEKIKKEIPRAKYMENYYVVEYNSFNVFTASETRHRFDNERHEIGNYFLTEEQSKRASDKLKQALSDFWKEELK